MAFDAQQQILQEQPAPQQPASIGVLDVLDRLQDWSIIGLVVAMAAIVNLQIFSRYIFDSPFMWAEEVTRLILVWLTFIAGSLLIRRGGDIVVDTLVNMLPKRTKRIADVLRDVTLMLIYSFVTVKSYQVARGVEDMPLIATEWSTALLVWPVCVGAAFSVFYAAIRLAETKKEKKAEI